MVNKQSSQKYKIKYNLKLLQILDCLKNNKTVHSLFLALKYIKSISKNSKLRQLVSLSAIKDLN